MMKSKRFRILLVCVSFLLPMKNLAQMQDKIYMHQGNKSFLKKGFDDAEINYRKALDINPQNSRVHYNLGNALLYQKKPKEAMKEYEKAVLLEKKSRFKAAIYHNMGIILQSQKKFGPAIECYKESLRNNPDDNTTRYNLALCQYQQKKNSKNKNQNKNKNKDQSKQQNKNRNQQKKEQQKKEQQKNQMSKDNADQLLRAAMMKENKTQEKVRKALQHPSKKQMEENW